MNWYKKAKYEIKPLSYIDDNLSKDKASKELKNLCDALNAIDGVAVPLDGYGRRRFPEIDNNEPLCISLEIESEEGLAFLIRCIDHRYFKYGHKWILDSTISDTGDWGLNIINFFLMSKGKLKDIKKEIIALAENIESHITDEDFLALCDMDINNFNVSNKNDSTTDDSEE